MINTPAQLKDAAETKDTRKQLQELSFQDLETVFKYQFEGLKMLAEWAKWRAAIEIVAIGTLLPLAGLGQSSGIDPRVAGVAFLSFCSLLFSLWADGSLLLALPLIIYYLPENPQEKFFDQNWDRRRIGGYTSKGTWGFLIGFALYAIAIGFAIFIHGHSQPVPHQAAPHLHLAALGRD